MIPTIETLEKEIEQFHKNVSGSNALIKNIENVIAAIKEQNIVFEKKVGELKETTKTLPPETAEIVKKQLDLFFTKQTEEQNRLLEAAKAAGEEYKKAMAASQTEINKVPGEIDRNLHKALVSLDSALVSYENKYAEKLEKEITSFHENVIAAVDMVKTLDKVTDTVKTHTEELKKTAEKLPPETAEEVKKQLDSFYTVFKDDEKKHINEIILLTDKYKNENNTLNTELKAEHQKYIDEIISLTDKYRKENNSFYAELKAEHQKFIDNIFSYLSDYKNDISSCQADLMIIPEKINSGVNSTLDETKKIFESSAKIYTDKISEETNRYIESAHFYSKHLETSYNDFTKKLTEANITGIYPMLEKMNRKMNLKLNISVAASCAAFIIALISFFL